MFVAESHCHEIQQELQEWVSAMHSDIDAALSSKIPARLRGLMFRSNLETLSSFQYAFAETHSEIPPPHPLVSQIWWSSFMQSWTSRITKQFLLHLLLKFEVSSEALPDSHSISDSSLLHCVSNGHSISPEHSAEGGDLQITTVSSIKAEPDEKIETTFSEEILPEDEVSSDGFNDLSASRMNHRYLYTKNVPAAFAYHMRGVECDHCFAVFRGMKCVDELVKHTKVRHKNFATAKLLKKLRSANTPEKVIGAGMRYCGCPSCISANRDLGITC